MPPSGPASALPPWLCKFPFTFRAVDRHDGGDQHRAWRGTLIAAGLYQLSPLKQACLRKCQTPLMFFARNWRKGYGGALRMGLSHGLYCLGCCWVLMGLLFYGGVMELRWIVGLALYVAAEKLLPPSAQLSRFMGILLIGWGLWTGSGLASASA